MLKYFKLNWGEADCHDQQLPILWQNFKGATTTGLKLKNGDTSLRKSITLSYTGENNSPVREGYANDILILNTNTPLQAPGWQEASGEYERESVQSADKLLVHSQLGERFPHAAQTRITLTPQTPSVLTDPASHALKSRIARWFDCLLLKFVSCSFGGFTLMKLLPSFYSVFSFPQCFSLLSLWEYLFSFVLAFFHLPLRLKHVVTNSFIL